MPLIIEGTTYPMPGESGQTFATGAELMAIEDFFGLDALQLLSTSTQANAQPGYTRTKAMYALTWIAVHRVDATVTLAQHVERPFDDFDLVDEENPTSAASPAAESDAE